ncbi:TaqI-like C-terminal specificity domain-containing protein [Tepidibacillus infernus]|uniref:TaqI-like C-terminal specificity domain-containing protein n=1 Tax=Tepidibacillus infernus TaxID=1806172 RepID=UPI003B70826D
MGQTDLEQRYIHIDEVAHLLAVSTATVRNWVKTGRLQKVLKKNRDTLFQIEEVLKLKHEIETGKTERLKSRRNKKAVKGNFIPTEYVTYSPYLSYAEQIIEIAKEIKHQEKVRLVLFEVVLNLLLAQGKIETHITQNDSSFTELISKDQLSLQKYELILESLFDYRNGNIQESDLIALQKVRQLHIPFVEGDDFLGLVYMSLSHLGKRKNNGSYYTPSTIVDSLVDKSLTFFEKDKLSKAVDPCCGSGNFLIKLFLRLKSQLLESGHQNIKEVEQRLIEESIAGFDIDEIAVALARINLVLLLESEIDVQSILNIRSRNSLEAYGYHLFSTYDKDQYDLVIGNPPWGYHFSQDEVEFYRDRYLTAQGSLESFVLFLESGIHMLRENGLLAYVLPESLLNVKSHLPIRKILLEQTELLNIKVLGQQFSKVFAPAITLIVRNRKSSPDHQITVEDENLIVSISQKRFLNNDLHIFNVKSSDAEDQLIEQMKSLPGVQYLKDHAHFALGIVTGDNKAYLSQVKPVGGEPILKGNDVDKYNYYVGNHYIVFTPEKFQQVAPVSLYRAKEKLIYRFINETLTFAYDHQQTLSLNSANILIPTLEGYLIKYILAVLNSRPVQFFYTLSFSSVKILRKHIESIPIPPCDQKEQMEIEKLVDQLMSVNSPEQRLELYERIDDRIMGLYQLHPEQKEYIKKKFKQVRNLSR